MTNEYLTVTEVQTRMLEMLDVLLQYFEAHNYHYVLTGGSALGAVRHKSIIPWDDDMDIALPRDEYEKFIVDFQSNDDRFVLKNEHQPDWGYAYARLSDSSTEYVYRWGNVDNGVFIDIFPIDKLPESKYGQYLTYTLMKGLDVIRNAARRKDYQPGDRFIFWKKLLANAFKLANGAKIAHLQVHLAKMVDYICRKSGYSGLYVVQGINKLKEVNTSTTYLQTKDACLNGRKVKIPFNSNKYLTKLYGPEYMMLPPVQNRKTHGKFKQKKNA